MIQKKVLSQKEKASVSYASLYNKPNAKLNEKGCTMSAALS
jgi:hypothetical protein